MIVLYSYIEIFLVLFIIVDVVVVFISSRKKF